MKMKTVATCSPMLLCLLAGGARAALEPFSFEASETVQHDSNILRESGSSHTGDWLSTTEFSAALNQAVGREQIKASASVNVDRYGKLHERNSEGYSVAGELDWSTIGDLSGALGADSRRHQYLNGLDGEGVTTTKNLETDNHAFARAQLGGMGRWSIFSGFDASQRTYSAASFDPEEVQQWAVSGGSSYETSPDLSFGVQGRYVRGKYPHATLLNGSEQTFTVKTAGVNTRWTVSGNTSFDANVGYTEQRTDGQPDQHYINGAMNWTWAPPSHFRVTFGASRDGDTNIGQGATLANTNGNVNGRSLNTIAHLDVNYELTAKVTLDAGAQYIHRKYSDAQISIPTGFTDINGNPVFNVENVTGASNTSRFTLSANYLPTRTTTLSCGVSRELHSADHSIIGISQPYTDNTVQCSGSIRFD